MSLTPPTGEEFGPCLSVVVPCYNEEATVAELVGRVLDSPVVGQVVIVDDASTDASWKAISSIDDDRVTTARHAFNMGKGAAIAYGISMANQPYVVVQDADLEYDPAEYPKLLEPLVADLADAVYGSRFHTQRPHRVLYYWHSVGNRVLTTASNMVTNLNLTDMETCYKMCRTDLLQRIDLEEDRFGVEPEMTAKLAHAGARIYEVGISYHGRTYEEGKKIGWKDGVRAFYCIAKYSRRRDPFPPADEVSAFEASEELSESLAALEGADNYNSMIGDLIEPYLGSSVVEIGSGTGTVAAGLVRRLRRTGSDWSYLASEPGADLFAELQRRFADEPAVDTLHGDGLAALDTVDSCDSIVLVNVLEHIEHDQDFVRQAARRLRGGGALVLWVPAGKALYSGSDLAMGHYRRYTPSTLRRLLARAGMVPEVLDFHNGPGAAAWWLIAKKLGRQPTDGALPSIYDRAVVPVVARAEQRFRPPYGQSLFCVARVRSDFDLD